ncbi:hypothetical protein K491DRAFT_688044 [Lophiostoma macrostomum CBS 122681]|uniref:Uncharacterized protein n=1 Tax=Lophiostoma macrostomum CBS 122681 TaxID=1314788 RepID=A0A6A6TNS1_9PLEO|nr:hypothetical protein K491DRAFT_688044 [Lophiostoma macrostomum CBS 122681]
MSSSSTIPVLFTIPPSNRHEVILIDTSSKPTLKALNAQITSTIADSPNCAEFMGKYKNKEDLEQIQEFRIHWSESGRDRKVWPEFTVVTAQNWPAILELMKLGAGKDVLEIKVGKSE